jgi:hypothetical protein
VTAEGGPNPAALLAGLEHAAEQPITEFDHVLLDLSSDLGRRVDRVLQVVFEVPAQPFQFLNAQVEPDLSRCRRLRPVTFDGDIDLVKAWNGGGPLDQLECAHRHQSR